MRWVLSRFSTQESSIMIAISAPDEDNEGQGGGPSSPRTPLSTASRPGREAWGVDIGQSGGVWLNVRGRASHSHPSGKCPRESFERWGSAILNVRECWIWRWSGSGLNETTQRRVGPWFLVLHQQRGLLQVNILMVRSRGHGGRTGSRAGSSQA